MKLLVTGADGQLASHLREVAAHYPEINVLFCNKQQLDITDPESIKHSLQTFKPDWVINTAAYTAVDKAESEPALAYALNAEAPEKLAQACADEGIALLHLSTDYVFDGKSKTPYSEGTPTEPVNVYGKSKLLGEQQALCSNPKTIIVRVAWIFGPYGNNFLKTMLNLAKNRDQLSIVSNQQGCPTYTGDLANALIQMVLQDKSQWGIYHYRGGEPTNWFEFAKTIFASALKLKLIKAVPALTAIDASEYPTPAQRPDYSVLSGDKMAAEYAIPAGDWRQGVEKSLIALKKTD